MPILGKLYLLTNLNQEAPRPFLGISLLNIASQKRLDLHWKTFLMLIAYCFRTHEANYTELLKSIPIRLALFYKQLMNLNTIHLLNVEKKRHTYASVVS